MSFRVIDRGPATKNFNYRTMLVCILGLIGAGLVPTLVIRALGMNNGFWLIGNIWRGEGGGDSWGAIAKALQYLDAHGSDQFYEAVYYKSVHQFIYSPLSLIFFRVTQLPPFIDWYSQDQMNNVSWWVMLAMIVVMTLIIRQSSIRFGVSGSAPDLGQTICMALLAAISVTTFYPIIAGFRNGQIQTWLDFLAMLSLLFLILDPRALAGVCIGLVCIVKPQLGVMFLWGALRREWWFVAGGLVVVGVFGMASLMTYGLSIHLDYASLIKFLSRRGESFVGNQSVNGLLNRMFFLGPNVIFEPTHTQMTYNVWVHAGTIISSAVMILVALFFRSTRNTFDEVMDFCPAMLLLTLASPVAYTHHYGLVLPIFWLALLWLRSEESRRPVLYCLLFLSYAMFSNDFAISNALAETSWNFLQSMPMFGAFTLFGVLCALRFGSPKVTAVSMA